MELAQLLHSSDNPVNLGRLLDSGLRIAESQLGVQQAPQPTQQVLNTPGQPAPQPTPQVGEGGLASIMSMFKDKRFLVPILIGGVLLLVGWKFLRK
jgi:hypothetical protein